MDERLNTHEYEPTRGWVEVEGAPGVWMGLLEPDTDDWVAAAELEFTHFRRRKFTATYEDLQNDYARYRPVSSMLAIAKGVLGSTAKIVACTRIIRYNLGIGFKTIHDADHNLEEHLTFTDEGWDKVIEVGCNNMLEVGTAAADDGFGSMIYGAMIGLGAGRVPYGIASLDEVVYEKSARPLFGDGIRPLGPFNHYMGSPTAPTLLDFAAMVENARKRRQMAINERSRNRIDDLLRGAEVAARWAF